MRHFTRNVQHTVPEGKHKRQSRARRPAVEGLEERALLSTAHHLAVHKHIAVPDAKNANEYGVTPLVSNILLPAFNTDPRLVNPWDINFPQRPGQDPWVWVADQGTGVVTMYQISKNGNTVRKSPLAVTIPTVPRSMSTQTGPTGVVQDPTNSFRMRLPDGKSIPATYIFDTLQGTIEAYNVPINYGIPSPSAEIVVINNPSTTEYTGLAAGTVKVKGVNQHYIYAANDLASPGIDVYNKSFQRVTFPQTGFLPNFFDPNLSPGFTPYGVHDLGNTLIVTYRGPGGQGGAVAQFMNDGQFMKQFGPNGASVPLESPWGAARLSSQTAAKIAGFSQYYKDVLIGNTGSGQIDAYNFTSGKFDGTLDDKDGSPITIPGLRTIHFGPGLKPFSIVRSGPGKTRIGLFFTKGSDHSDNRSYSLYGEITPLIS
jgi:uncharacterized protein (TIGR03118 family)